MSRVINMRRLFIKSFCCLTAMIAFSLCQLAVAGETSLRFHSQPGDLIGGGIHQEFTAADGTFAISNLGANSVQLEFTSTSQAISIRFGAPLGQALSLGVYPNVAGQAETQGFFLEIVNSPGLVCYKNIGSFQIKELSFARDGRVASFWANFVYHCGANRPALIGELRYNASVILNVMAPLEVFAERLQPLTFSVTANGVSGDRVSLMATGLPPGASFTDNQDNTGTFLWNPAFDQIGKFVIEFHGNQTGGASQSAATVINVSGETSLILDSDPGDVVGQGQQLLLKPSEGTFALSSGQINEIVIGFSAPTLDQRWYLGFRMPFGTEFKPGRYVATPVREASNESHLLVQGPWEVCPSNSTIGSFEIKQIVYDVSRNVRSFWATFLQQCGPGLPALRGEIRFNTGALVVNAPDNILHDRGETLRFDVAASDVLGRQVSLFAPELPPGAGFTDNLDGTGTFTWTPALTSKGRFLAKFQAVNGQGSVDVTQTRITIPGENYLLLDSEKGDYVGRGVLTFYVAPDDGSVSGNLDRETRLSFSRGSGRAPIFLTFAAQPAQLLTPGFYSAFDQSDRETNPWLSIHNDNCISSGTGSFHVKQAVAGELGNLSQFWARFEFHCADQTPGVFGEVRVNADITVVAKAPYRQLAPVGQLLTFDVSATDIQGRRTTFTVNDLPDGATFVDNLNNTGTLRWTPRLGQQGKHVVTFYASNGQGGYDSVTTTINIPARLGIDVFGNGVVQSDGVVCPGDCDEAYPNGGWITLRAMPATGYFVEQWTGCDIVSYLNTCTLRMTRDKIVSVLFARITYRLTVEIADNGVVTGNGITCPAHCTELFEPGTVIRLSGLSLPGRYPRWRGCGRQDGLDCVVTMWQEHTVSVSFPHENTVPSRRYLPLKPGNFWTYSLGGACCFTTVVLPDKVNINGVETYAVRDDDGYIEYLTNDVFGIREHGFYDPASNLEVVFSPPVVLATGAMESGFGSVRGIAHTGYGDFAYSASYMIGGSEVASVPLRTYHATSVRVGISISGLGLGNRTFSLARDVGIVKTVTHEGPDSRAVELVATNVHGSNDFDGDGSKDVAIYRNGFWSIQQSANNSRLVSWGGPTWQPVPEDYDGDGLLDIAVYGAGAWSILRSTDGGNTLAGFGGTGWTPVPADYDGDGKADFAVYNAGAWSIARSSDGGNTTFAWGGPAWTPVVADYDGDGKADMAVYFNGAWSIKRSSDNGTTLTGHGGSTWQPVPGDYDGDGKADIAVYMNGAWSILRSSDNVIMVIGHGGPDWVPVPGDYDGDGKTDVAVYHPIGAWSIKRSSDGAIQVVGHGGGPTDVPLN